MSSGVRLTRRRAFSLAWGLGASGLIAACGPAGSDPVSTPPPALTQLTEPPADPPAEAEPTPTPTETPVEVAPTEPPAEAEPTPTRTETPVESDPETNPLESSAEEEPGPPPAVPVATPQDSMDDQPPPKPFAGTIIDFSYVDPYPATRQALRAEAAKFAELTGINIEFDFSFKLPTSGELPAPNADVWYGKSTWIPSLVAYDYVLELDDYVAQWDQWPDFYPNAVEDVTYQGHVYGIPLNTYHRGSVVFRPSRFEAAGLQPEPPSTWEELNESARRLTIRDDREFFEQSGINLHHHTQVYEDWLIQAGGRPFNADLSRPTNDTPEGHLALSQHVLHGLTDRSMPIDGMKSSIVNLHAFCAGRVAMQLLWPRDVTACEQNAPFVFADLSVGPPLQGPSQRGMQLYVDKYMASRWRRHHDAAFETIKYFSSPGPNYDINIFPNRFLPCRGAAAVFPLFESDPWRSLADNTRYAQSRLIAPEHFAIEPAMSRWVEQSALGQLSVDEALRGMDREVAEIIA